MTIIYRTSVTLIALFGLVACGGPTAASGRHAANSPREGYAEPSAQELYDLGVKLAGTGQHLRAEHYLRLAERRGMPSTKVTPALIDVYLRSQQLSAAALLGESYLKAHPDDWSLRMTTAVVLSILGRHERARGHLEQIVRSRPELAIAHYQLGALLRDFFPHDAAEARTHFERYVELDPSGSYQAEARGYLTHVGGPNAAQEDDVPAPVKTPSHETAAP